MSHWEFVFGLLLFLSGMAWGQPSIEGRWKTIDDKTGEVRSVIAISEQDGEWVGEISEIMDPSEPNPTCDKCPDEFQDQPVLGLQIMWGLERKGDEWKGGRILDPENGKTYRCKLWLEDEDRLRVRGYLGPFYRTQTWERDSP